MGCLGGGSTTIEAAQPTAQQTELMQMQLNALKQSEAESAQIRPLILQAMGYKEVTPALSAEDQATLNDLQKQIEASRNEQTSISNAAYARGGATAEDMANLSRLKAQENDLAGKIAAFSPKTIYQPLTEGEIKGGMTPLEQQQYDAAKLQLERYTKALKGELPVDPALENQITEQEKVLKEQLARDLGPGWANSTAGNQRWSEFQKNANLLRDAARRGEINTGSALTLNQMGYLSNKQAQTGQQATQYGNMGWSSLPTYNTVLQPYIAQQQLTTNADIASAQASAQQQAGIWGGLGSLVGLGTGLFGNRMGWFNPTK